MALHWLGLKQQALARFERLQQRLNALYPAGAALKPADELSLSEDRGFLQEAGETIFGKGWSPKPNKTGKKTS
jgi:hypothetical protein